MTLSAPSFDFVSKTRGLAANLGLYRKLIARQRLRHKKLCPGPGGVVQPVKIYRSYRSLITVQTSLAVCHSYTRVRSWNPKTFDAVHGTPALLDTDRARTSVLHLGNKFDLI